MSIIEAYMNALVSLEKQVGPLSQDKQRLILKATRDVFAVLSEVASLDELDEEEVPMVLDIVKTVFIELAKGIS